jgi:OOP family OmpA-OmpF porin
LRRLLLACAGLVLCAPVLAAAPVDLSFPGPARITATRTEPMTTFRVPAGPFAAGSLPVETAQGALEQTAWQVEAGGVTTLELITALRAQVLAQGFAPIFECDTDACGGYDFRFGTAVMPEPDMHVDLGDFRYLAARREGSGGAEYVALLVSRSAHEGFVQMTQIGASLRPVPALTTSTKSPEPPAVLPPKDQSAFALPGPAGQTPVAGPQTLGSRLELGQPQPLEDLVFASGSSELAPGDYPSLEALAMWLKADPARKVTLVGHTDASGGLEANVRLSKARAESVRRRLIGTLGVSAGQVTAEGVGYLAPRATNQTEEGRQQNRRVEVISTSTQLLAP